MVIGDLRVLGKPVDLHSAYSAAQTIDLLQRHPDFAIILLDVVMEEDNSGLKLVEHIRRAMNNSFIRIILRTGQPGSAPEEKVITEYDINDYKSKTELTAQKLRTAVISAVGSYHDIIMLEQNRQGLKKIIEAAPGMFEIQPLKKFAAGTLQQIASLIKAGSGTLFYRPAEEPGGTEGDSFIVLAGTGKHERDTDRKLKETASKAAYSTILSVVENKKSIIEGNNYISFFESEIGGQNILFFEDVPPLSPLDLELVDIFCLNMSIAFDNIILNDEIEDTQKELCLTFGEFVEKRSFETGNHVKRVAQYARHLARAKGLPESEIDVLYLASAIHDIGKIAIPDHVLNKPDFLNAEEMEIMRKHSELGYELFKFSKRHLFQTATIIAHQHHEHWDGSGYPDGLKGEEIHLYARITAIADVFDALTCDRIYRKAWSLDKTKAYFEEQRGKMFDPELTDLFLSDFDSYQVIRETDED